MSAHPDPDPVGASAGDAEAAVAHAAGTDVALACVQALLRVESRADAVLVLHRAVVELGGAVRPTALAAESVLDVDVSLGIGEARAVVAGSAETRATAMLRDWLPILVEDAQAAAARCDLHQRQAARARTDALTGLSDRREGDERLAAACPGDVVCLLDLDGFKGLNDSRGHAAGDRALRRFGEILRDNVRDVDFVGRHGGDEFLVILTGVRVAVAVKRMRHIASAWTAEDPTNGVSIGIAGIDGRGTEAASTASDRALYRGKRSGGRQVVLAATDDYPPAAS